MTKLRKIIIIGYCLVLILICIYVPWEAGFYNAVNKIPAGYAFIWNAPTYCYIYADGTKIIGTTNKSGLLGKSDSAFDKLLYKYENYPTSTIPIVGVDLKRLTLEIIAVTAAAGIAYLAAGINRDSSNV